MRWKYSKADWHVFTMVLDETLQDVPIELDVNDREKYIIQALQNAAKKAIPRVAGGKKHDNLWFYSATVKQAIHMVNTHLTAYKYNTGPGRSSLKKKQELESNSVKD